MTHTDNSAEFGYGVPDGKVDLDDYAVFMAEYVNDSLIADLTKSGYTTPGGGSFNGEPDGIIDGDDLIYFLAFYANCESLGLCPSCP